MRKIQATIAIYAIIVIVMSVFFMPMNKTFGAGPAKMNIDTVEYKRFWETTIDKLDDSSFQYYSYDTEAHKLNLSIVTIVFASIIAIQFAGIKRVKL